MEIGAHRPLARLAIALVVGSAFTVTPVACSNRDNITPPPAVRFLAADQGTGVATNPILGLYIDDYGRGQAAGLPALAAAVRLRTWPELADVAFTVSYSDVGAPRANPDAIPDWAVVEVQPTTPLANRWYVVQVLSLPSGYRFLDRPMDGRVLADGSRGAIFRVGSEPSLFGVEICPPARARTDYTVVVYFSEPVQATPSVASHIVFSQGGSTLSCWPRTGPEELRPPTHVRFDCRPIDLAAPLVVDFTPGIVGTTGTPLGRHAGHPSSYSMTYGALPEGEPTYCHLYNP